VHCSTCIGSASPTRLPGIVRKKKQKKGKQKKGREKKERRKENRKKINYLFFLEIVTHNLY
jgi:hypothetical protein